MSPTSDSRRLSTVIALAGVVATGLAAVFVVALGQGSGSAGSDLVLVPRSELEAAAAAEAPPYQLQEITRLEGPTQVAPRPGTEDLYVTQLGGQVIRLTPNADGGFDTVEPPVLDISGEVSSQEGLEGLVALTFSADGGTLYLGYIDPAHDQVVMAYPVEADGASFGAGVEILTVDRPPGPPNNHIGGSLAFGPDGFLYVGTGDGGAGAFQAPDSSSLYGKVLRIQPDPAEGGYTVPEGNTTDGNPDGLPEIWTLGMRNPFRIDFDRATGDLWVADVGEESLEEINRLGTDEGAGHNINLGWPQYAGSQEYFIDEPSPTRIPPTSPSYEYDHREGRCAVIGGEVYRGAEFSELAGDYLYTDLCSKALLGLREAPDGGYEEFVLATIDESQLVSVDAANDGTIYLTSTSGGVYRLVPAA
jgi:glucose/arabinose dehydrogenase